MRIGGGGRMGSRYLCWMVIGEIGFVVVAAAGLGDCNFSWMQQQKMTRVFW